MLLGENIEKKFYVLKVEKDFSILAKINYKEIFKIN